MLPLDTSYANLTKTTSQIWQRCVPPIMAESLLTPSGITLSSLKGNSASEHREERKEERKSNHTLIGTKRIFKI